MHLYVHEKFHALTVDTLLIVILRCATSQVHHCVLHVHEGTLIFDLSYHAWQQLSM